MGKKLLLLGLVLVLVGVWTPNVFAIGYVGRPTAELSKGQWSAGFNYSYSTQDLDKTKLKGSELEGWYAPDGSFTIYEPGSGPVGPEKWKFKDLNTQRYLGRIAYGINDCWEVYGQLGGADVKGKFSDFDTEDDEWSEWEGVNFDNDFTWGWGTKFTFAKQDSTAWGVAIQMNWLDTSCSEKGSETSVDEDGSTWLDSEKNTLDIESYDLVIAVGPTVDMGGWRLYGGPFYYYLSGDIDVEWTETSTTEDIPGYTWYERGSISGDLKAKSNFGGYIGAQVDISKTCNASLEFSATGDGWGAGAGLTFLCK